MAFYTGLTTGQVQDLTDMLADDYMGLVAVIQPDCPQAFKTEMMTSAKKVVMMMSKAGMSQEQVAAYLRAAHLDGLVEPLGLVARGPAPQEAPSTTITEREAGQLAKAMCETMGGFQGTLRMLIQGDTPRDPSHGPLEFKRLSQHGWLVKAEQVFHAVRANKVDRALVHEALSRLGYSGVADDVLGHNDVYMQDNENESAHGSGPATVTPPPFLQDEA